MAKVLSRSKEKYIPKGEGFFSVYTYELNLDGEKEKSLKEINGLLEDIIHKIEEKFRDEGVKLRK